MPTNLVRQRFFALSIALVFAFAATILSPTAPTADAAQQSLRARKIHHSANVAVNQIGDPYQYGSDGPNAFDCSGLTKFAYHKAGLYLPRSSDAQGRYVRHIKRKNLRHGDLIFFTGGGGVYHVAMFMRWKDHRRIILHAPNSGGHVTRAKIWDNNWFAGTLRSR